MTTGIIIAGCLFAGLCVLCAVCFNLAGAKRDELQEDIGFTEEFWRWPPV